MMWEGGGAGFGASVEGADFIRFRADVGPTRALQREWLHFVVRLPGCDLLVNFSLVERAPPAARISGNLLLLLRSTGDAGEEWDGDLDEHEVGRADVGTGRIRLRLGECSLGFDGSYRVSARCRRRPLSVELVLTPRCLPYLVHNVALDGGSMIHWAVTPSLSVSGVVRRGDRVIRLDDAPGYHDHNWGTFGGDLAWEWGCSLGAGAAHDVVLVRVLDRVRARVVSQGLLVWDGGERRRVFRDREVDFEASGWLRPQGSLRVPRGLSLLAPGAATGVPRRLHIRAAGARDRLEGEFVAEDLARVLVPRDGDLGTTVINEVVGRLRLGGVIGEGPVDLDVPAFFEFLGEAG